MAYSKERRVILFERSANTYEGGTRLLDLTHEQGSTLLHYAALRNDPDVVSELLMRGARMDIANRLGFLPIHVAVLNPNIAILKAFLAYARRDELAAVTASGLSALLLAVIWGREEHVALLVANGMTVAAEYQGELFDLLAARAARLRAMADADAEGTPPLPDSDDDYSDDDSDTEDDDGENDAAAPAALIRPGFRDAQPYLRRTVHEVEGAGLPRRKAPCHAAL